MPLNLVSMSLISSSTSLRLLATVLSLRNLRRLTGSIHSGLRGLTSLASSGSPSWCFRNAASKCLDIDWYSWVMLTGPNSVL